MRQVSLDTPICIQIASKPETISNKIYAFGEFNYYQLIPMTLEI